MIYCLNPNCHKPQNPDSNKFCQNCGLKLQTLLRNRYRIMRPLGQGGFGKTYLAEDLDRRNAYCAIKQFAPTPIIMANLQTYHKALEFFEKEAEQLLHLGEHPQIPTLFAYFEQDRYLYLVQQFIPGQNLYQELTAKGNFNEDEIRELLEDLLPVLQFIHDRQIIHRDLKPENIIRRDPDNAIVGGKFALIDFGVAKQWYGSYLNKQGTIAGTPSYAPIEQIRGMAYPASDLYSLGVTCIRLITGCLPNDDGSDLLYDALDARWLWREKLPINMTFSSQISDILEKMLCDSVKQRYQTANQILEALNNQSKTKKRVSKKSPSYNLPSATPSAKKTTAKKAVTAFPNLSLVEFSVTTINSNGRRFSHQQKAQIFNEDIAPGVTLKMVYIPAGSFMMGSAYREGKPSEMPQHEVEIKAFFMGQYPVTQEQFAAVMGENPANFKRGRRPVEQVSWLKAIEFCQKLSLKTGRNYRLPSEAEWEYSCRAGSISPFYFGEIITPDLANYTNHQQANSGYRTYEQTSDVTNFPPNDFGLCDLHGNVWEWCQDLWHNNYQGAPSDGSAWEAPENSNGDRVLRGGSWYSDDHSCRSANRHHKYASYWENSIGFRVCCDIILV